MVSDRMWHEKSILSVQKIPIIHDKNAKVVIRRFQHAEDSQPRPSEWRDPRKSSRHRRRKLFGSAYRKCRSWLQKPPFPQSAVLRRERQPRQNRICYFVCHSLSWSNLFRSNISTICGPIGLYGADHDPTQRVDTTDVRPATYWYNMNYRPIAYEKQNEILPEIRKSSS
jgi:hypothetical protein